MTDRPCGHHHLTGVVGTHQAVCDDCGAVETVLEFAGPPESVDEDGTISLPFRLATFDTPDRLGTPDDDGGHQ